MILFNFIQFFRIGQHYNGKSTFHYWQLNKQSVNFNNKSLMKYMFFKKRSYMIVSNNNFIDNKGYNNLLLSETENNTLLSRNFLQELINRYIKETVFISPSNSLSTIYSSRLKSLGLSVYKGNEYKKFLHSFNKDLIKGKINVNLDSLKKSVFSFPKQKRYIYLKYNWPKLSNFHNIFFLSYKEQVISSFIRNMSNLLNSALPLFIIVNSNKEIIVSESVQQLSKKEVFFGRFSTNSGLNKNLYTGLLFINPQDALEYKNYIESQCLYSTRKTNINVVPANISLYHKLMKLGNNSIEFRLVPDLKEISDLTHIYRKYKNISFNVNQKYGRNFFQGQPLYIVKPFNIKSNNNANAIAFNSLFSPGPKENNASCKYRPVFLHYNTLLSIWNKLKKDNPDYNLPSKPPVSVFNLESFIDSISDDKNYSKTIFLPSYKTYCFIKNYLQKKFNYKEGSQHWISHKSLALKTLCMRVFWSLTSRQPINW